MTESVEHVIVGGGPAGLRAAQVLAEAGREVLVLERNGEIGPKACAGGLTGKTMRELAPLGLPLQAGLERVGYVSFNYEPPIVLDPEATVVRAIARRALGALQADWARRAGAELRPATAATDLDLAGRTLHAGGRVIRFRHLLGADGAASGVRRALGLWSPRAYFAGEFNVPALRIEPLRIECDSRGLGNGYFWVFPHTDYTSIGAVAPKKLIPPAAVRRYLEARAGALGAALEGVPFEGATLEVHAVALAPRPYVHLAGDAAGLPSALTAEGIYAAIVSGEESARLALEPRYPCPKTRRWLRVKRTHDAVARALWSRRARDLTLPALGALARWRPVARQLAAWFLAA
jgi:geranylgeranyl reductase